MATGAVMEVTTIGRASKAATRREIVMTEAGKLFAQNGFHSTGIAQIARSSGVQVGQLYRDFACKEDIVAAIVERDIGAMLDDQALRSAWQCGDSAAVRAWIIDFLRPPEACDGPLIAEIFAEATRNPRVGAIVESVRSRLRASMIRALELLAPDPDRAAAREVLADVILAIAHGIRYHHGCGASVGSPLAEAALVALIEGQLDAFLDAAPSTRMRRAG